MVAMFDDRLGRPIRLSPIDPPQVQVRRPLDGADDNNFGQSIDLDLGEVSKILLDARGLDQAPELVTCFVTYDLRSDSQASDDLTGLRLHAEFGVGGTSQRVSMDLVRGLYFAVPATALRLIVDYPRANPQQTGPRLQVRAVLAYGAKSNTAGATSPVRLTQPIGTIDANSESQLFAIPALATSVLVTSTAAVARMIVVQRTGATPGARALAESVASTTSAVLLNGAQGFSVRAVGADAPNVNAIFELAI